jgi:hypothetical protein
MMLINRNSLSRALLADLITVIRPVLLSVRPCEMPAAVACASAVRLYWSAWALL